MRAFRDKPYSLRRLGLRIIAVWTLGALILGLSAIPSWAAPVDVGVAITAPATNANVKQGTALAYTIVVTNNDADALAPPVTVTLTDVLGGATFVGASDITCAEAPVGTVTCTNPALASQATWTVTVNVTAPGAPGPLANTATVAMMGDTVAGNDQAVKNVNVVATLADVTITKNHSAGTLSPGSPVTYNLQVSNAGPDPAMGVTTTDTLGSSLTFASSSSGCTAVGQVVTCPVPNVAMGTPQTVSFTATISSSAPPSTPITNTASVSTSTPESNASNNTSNTDSFTPAIAPAELALTLADTPDPVGPGGDLTYSITLTNAGPNAATNVAVTSSVPAETTFVSADNGGTLSGSAVNWTVPTVTQATPVTLTYIVNANDDITAGSLSATATLTYGGDTTATDNSATAATAIGGDADLLVVMSADSLSPEKGDLVTFAIAVGNAGPNDAAGIVLTDKLPAGLKFDSASDGPTQGIAASDIYNASTGEWDPFDLASGDSATFTLTAVVNTTSPVTNRATASLAAGFSDPIVQNSADSVTLNQAGGGGNGGGGGSGGGAAVVVVVPAAPAEPVARPARGQPSPVSPQPS